MAMYGDSSLLRTLKNPVHGDYRWEAETSEFTFFGYPTQPDYATVRVAMIPGEHVLELKSLKQYLASFRDEQMSYERALDTICSDIALACQPHWLRVEIETCVRGGIKSRLVMQWTYDREHLV